MINEIDSESLQQRISDGADQLLVDIRTPAEMAQGMIPDAMQLPMHLIPLRLAELPRDRDIVLYCRSGARSYQACAYMQQQGYDRVINLRGGIIAWARHGYPVAPPA
ncbi:MULTISPECIES: rhodanese-like domain-containing protein [Marichromatium]|uniref:Sulfurtransferase n=1 Tax=Marichromatium gracile TaxID=1048 RepID=A0A4R4AH16_MARGR|nr:MULTISPECIES: rhodanese-like domain-containing protein [Marichromatium]MBO8085366.1 rhodanese-like domain-containing protein [Marichromatium sp.]KXX66089.1 sulfurtransferase [Marichromatium gracile]MBK1710206.1 rhodanese-like domain-containing protein [Marichromatium gracile]RNE91215.1 rhodanese-like domain-containing protein [Marichromatium sp. AB31]RNE93261.1 rhodanese-like domain-containing protein [Marichromatium sp. AB32]